MRKNLTTDEFIIKSKKVHGNKYDYSLVEYLNTKSNVKIICVNHGIFEQQPRVHLKGSGCMKCVNITSNEGFIEKAKMVHGDKYDYSLVDYINMYSMVKIICPTHNVFEQQPRTHLKNIGCVSCNITEKFIIKANKLHNNVYDYSKTFYVNRTYKVCIICKEHGEFYQSIDSHMSGSGCPSCKNSRGENIIRNYLLENNIKFERQYKFLDCKNERLLPFDFYLPDYNICIEYQGEQHYKPVKIWGGDERLFYTQLCDKIKSDYCSDNNIKLLKIKYCDDIVNELNNNFL